MRSVNVYAIRGEKQVKRYTEHFYGPCDVRVSDRKAVALKRITDKFGRFHPDCRFSVKPL